MEQSPAAGLTPDQLSSYNTNGYLVLPNFWSPDTVSALNAEISHLISGVDLATVPISLFSTEEQCRTSDDWFLESGDKVRPFFEPSAFVEGKLVVPLSAAINKFGHNLHELSPPFAAVSFAPRIAAIAKSLGFAHPLVVQSMAILKPAHTGGAVGPHVDGAFLRTEPQSCVGMWWPLEDCTLTNGCLWAVPGSHTVPVARHFARTPPGQGGPGTCFTPAEATPFSLEGAVPLVIPAGSLVLLHASLVHYSHANTSSVSRAAYSIHMVEGAAGWEYPASNWLQRESPFPALY